MYEEMSLLEFQRAFSSEEACLKYLFEKRWPEGFQCPRCLRRTNLDSRFCFCG